jgi:hypothetical protein
MKTLSGDLIFKIEYPHSVCSAPLPLAQRNFNGGEMKINLGMSTDDAQLP